MLASLLWSLKQIKFDPNASRFLTHYGRTATRESAFVPRLRFTITADEYKENLAISIAYKLAPTTNDRASIF